MIDGRTPHAVVLDDWDGSAESSAAVTRLRDIATVVVLGDCDEAGVVDAAVDADIIIPIRERRVITKSLLDRLPRLRHIAQTGGSAVHIDLDAARANGVHVSTTPGASASSVAELAIAMMVCARRGIIDANTLLRGDRWERPLGRQLRNSTLGIIGWGATGREVAALGAAMGMNIILHSRRAPAGALVDGYESTTLDDVFKRSDIVSLHVELSESTRGMITRSHLRSLGAAGLLVNTARAALVDRDSLLDALDTGELGMAALDVFHSEPPDPGDPIVNHPSVLATPHLGWRTHAVMEAYLESAVDNITAWLNQLEEGN